MTPILTHDTNTASSFIIYKPVRLLELCYQIVPLVNPIQVLFSDTVGTKTIDETMILLAFTYTYNTHVSRSFDSPALTAFNFCFNSLSEFTCASWRPPVAS